MARASLAKTVAADLASGERLAADAEIARLRAEVAGLRARHKTAVTALNAERDRIEALVGLSGVKSQRPAAMKGGKSRHAATAIVVLSDWHVEETVGDEVGAAGQFNRYNLEIADARIAELGERIATLVEHERQLVKVDRIVIAALGDFCSGHIHEELMETTSLAPMAAMRWAAARLRGIIDLAADMAKEVIVVTQPGNHGRSNHGKPRAATEHEHSFEQNQYLIMAAEERRKNVTWQVSESYLGFLDLDGFIVRYHHGHAIRSFGAIGGITIAVNKAIAQWNRSQAADLDIFGHWHQFGWLRGRYVSNGSVIGMNAYGIRIKAEFEPPSQSLVIVDGGRREVTKALPIFCDRDLQQRRAERAASQ
jgi:hypothetical protein